MLQFYRRLTIPNKLRIAGLAMVVPLVILFFFMEISFRYDIDIGRTERIGAKYLRDAFHLKHSLGNLRMQSLLADLPPESVRSLELESGDPEQKAAEQLKRLTERTDRPLIAFGSGETGRNCFDAGRLRDAVGWYRADRTEAAYMNAGDALAEYVAAVSHCAHLALDPALDSQKVGEILVGYLPKSCRIMEDFQRLALDLLSRTPPDALASVTAEERDLLLGKVAVFRMGTLKPILDKSRIALAEDPHFYSASPTLKRNFGSLVTHYQRTASQLIEVAERMADGSGAPSELFNAATRVRAAGTRLFDSGVDELEILIENRIDSYQRWRMAGAGLSLLGIALAALALTAASRSVNRSVHAVVEYTQRVAGGDYNAQPDMDDLGPRMRAMVRDTDAMVGALKDKIGYLNGILQGMTVPCYVVDRDERITFINQPYFDLYERDGDLRDCLGRTLGDFFYDDPERETITGQCMKQGRPIVNEMVTSVTHKDSIVHVRLDVAPIHNLDGELIGAFAIITDLTELIQKEQAIDRLAAFPREAPDPVLSAAPDGSIQYLNTAASAIFETSGLSPDQGFLPETHHELVTSCLVTGDSRQNIESRVGTRHFSWTYHPIESQQIVHIYATDITKRIRAEEQLLHDAFHDTLTGLPNKALFLDRVSQTFRRAERQGASFAVLFLDLDGFKNINDGLGHAVGDKLLARCAWRMKKTLSQEETLARLGGDEFTVLLPTLNDDKHALRAADRIQNELKRPFQIEGHDLFVTASVGVINAPDGTKDADDLLRDAETAMYRAKALGRARAEIFNPAMHQDASERIQMENDMKKAIERGEFEPHYQPIVSLKDGSVAGFEALIRWNHPTQGLVSPARFIPIAEETGLIVPMGAFMLEAACKQAKIWQNRHPRHADLTMSVNMSVKQMTRPTIAGEIRSVLEYIGIPPDTVKIEITESGLMNNVGLASELLNELETFGVSLMIDDFGTGYSSLSHLHQFPFHFLKIDQSFVSTMEDKPDNMEIVKTIVSLAHSLGKQVVAEGVETESQRTHLRRLGCEYVQGYLFSPPVPAHKAELLLANDPEW